MKRPLRYCLGSESVARTVLSIYLQLPYWPYLHNDNAPHQRQQARNHALAIYCYQLHIKSQFRLCDKQRSLGKHALLAWGWDFQLICECSIMLMKWLIASLPLKKVCEAYICHFLRLLEDAFCQGITKIQHNCHGYSQDTHAQSSSA